MASRFTLSEVEGLVWSLIVWLVETWLVESLKFPNAQTVKALPPQTGNSLMVGFGRQRSHSPQCPYLKLVMSQKRKRSVAIED